VDIAVKNMSRERFTGLAAEDLIVIELEVDAKALGNLRVGAVSIQGALRRLCGVVEFDADGLKQRAGFLFLEVEVELRMTRKAAWESTS